METDDPWDWSVDRVVKELCTSDRSWTPRTTTASVHHPALLEKVLREQEVTGSVLLEDVNDQVLKDFGINVLGRRSYLLGAIKELRLQSEIYKEQHVPPLNVLPSHIIPSTIPNVLQTPASRSRSGFDPRLSTNGNLQNDLLIGPYFAAQGSLEVPNLPVEEVSRSLSDDVSTPVLPVEGSLRSDFVVPSVDSHKRRRLDLTDPANNLALQQDALPLRPATPSEPEEQSIQRKSPDEDVNMLQDDFPNSPTPGSHNKKRKRVSSVLVDSDPKVLSDPGYETSSPAASLPKPTPGITFVGMDGRKRLIPVYQPAFETDVPYDYDLLLQQRQIAEARELSTEPEQNTAQSFSVAKASNSGSEPAPLAVGYLGREMMPVDDVFYKDIDVNQEISMMQGPLEFYERQTISSGRRIYINNLMKRFFSTQREDFVREDKVYSAVRPYAMNLAPKYHSPSFTLYSSGNDERVIAKRESLRLWPEINPEASLLDSQVDTENATPFKSGVWEAYGQDFDPDSLEKWNTVLGGREVLPVYGDSDEENEYDPETWAEIEEERGTLERPERQLKRPLLSASQVHEAIDEGIKEMITKWKTQELPKKQCKAYYIWKKFRDGNARGARLSSIVKQISRIEDDRLPAMRKEIAGEYWTSQLQVRRQTRNMEQSIYDREGLAWEMEVIQNDVCPEKPLRKPPSLDTKSATLAGDDIEEGESLGSDTDPSSSDEDDMNDFIIDDPSTAEEEVELNFADSEDEADDSSTSETKETAIPISHSDSGLNSPTENNAFDSEVYSNTPSPKNHASTATVPKPPNKSMKASQYSPPKRIWKKEPGLPGPVKSFMNTSTTAIDLTMTSSDEGSPVRKSSFGVLDLTTPKKVTKIKLINKNSPSYVAPPPSFQVMISDEEESEKPDPNNLPPLSDPAAVAKFSAATWTSIPDVKRLLITVLYSMVPHSRDMLFSLISNITKKELWVTMNQVLEAVLHGQKDVKGIDAATFNTFINLIRLFQMFLDVKKRPFNVPKKATARKLQAKEDSYPAFYKLCRDFEGYFGGKSQSSGDKDDGDDDSDEGPRLATRRRRIVNPIDDNDEGSPHKIRKKPIYEDANARTLRDHDRQRIRDMEERKKRLRENFALTGGDSSQHDVIINESKFEHQGFIHVNDDIARRIKPHQIEGVRFMWNQLVTDEKEMQGCLLAHTMGLGKTMQVITLLVAIAEASGSTDEAIYSQIPPSLLGSKTMILCPPGLIDNWMDELLTWCPDNALGDFLKVGSGVSMDKRINAIETWYKKGGVLVIGYDTFRNMILNSQTKAQRQPALTDEMHAKVKEYLLKGPKIIVADEAHKMKNANSKITSAAAEFQSKSRIALTGSPLANNVEEYHTMIEWVAPNYLGPASEFRAKYVEPIQRGLWNDSTDSERRKSLKMLGVLKVDVAPKVHRADMSVLRNDLPPKKEFVITVALTDLQSKAYTIYVRSMRSNANTYKTTKDGDLLQTTIWHWLAVLSLLCNHPNCFNAKLIERKIDIQAKQRNNSPQAGSRDNTDPEESSKLDINAPAWKTGVSPELIAEITELFQAETSNLKLVEHSNKVKILCQILDGSKAVGDKTLVFSQSLPTLDFLEALFKSQGRTLFRLDGKTKMNDRQNMTKQFNSDNTEIYLISTNAGGLGLNLFSANRVVIFDFKFNPIMEEQAVGRAYRIGQQKPVFVYRFVAGGTFESSVHNKTVFKKQLASRVVDKKNPIAWATRNLSDFLFEPKHVKQENLSEFEGMDPDVLDNILASQSTDSTVRAIVQTDTFERDGEDKFTTEEQKEVDQLVKDSKLQRADPDAYAAEMRKRQAQSFAHQTGLTAGAYQLQLQAQRGGFHAAPPSSLPIGGSGSAKQWPAILPPQSISASQPLNDMQATTLGGNVMGADRVASTSKEANIRSLVGSVSKPILPASNGLQSNAKGATMEHKDLSPSVQSQTRPGKVTRRFSKKIFDVLNDNYPATPLDKNDESALLALNKYRSGSSRMSANILEALSKHITDKDEMDAAHHGVVRVLRADPSKVRDLVEGKISADKFTQEYLVANPPSSSMGSDSAEDITNTEMYKAMSRQPPRSLRTPVVARKGVSTSSPKHSHHSKIRRISGDESDSAPRKSVKRHGNTSSNLNTPSRSGPKPIPGWAERQLQQANSHKSRRSPSNSHASPPRKG